MAALLSSIVIVFLLCHSTKLITNVYEAYQMIRYGELIAWPQWADLLSKWNHFMLAVNSSINIVIYVIKVRLQGRLELMMLSKGFQVQSISFVTSFKAKRSKL